MVIERQNFEVQLDINPDKFCRSQSVDKFPIDDFVPKAGFYLRSYRLRPGKCCHHKVYRAGREDNWLLLHRLKNLIGPIIPKAWCR